MEINMLQSLGISLEKKTYQLNRLAYLLKETTLVGVHMVILTSVRHNPERI